MTRNIEMISRMWDDCAQIQGHFIWALANNTFDSHRSPGTDSGTITSKEPDYLCDQQMGQTRTRY